MSRTFKLLNASGKQVIHFRFKAIIIIMDTQVSVYVCEYTVHASKLCIYCVYIYTYIYM